MINALLLLPLPILVFRGFQQNCSKAGGSQHIWFTQIPRLMLVFSYIGSAHPLLPSFPKGCYMK